MLSKCPRIQKCISHPKTPNKTMKYEVYSIRLNSSNPNLHIQWQYLLGAPDNCSTASSKRPAVAMVSTRLSNSSTSEWRSLDSRQDLWLPLIFSKTQCVHVSKLNMWIWMLYMRIEFESWILGVPILKPSKCIFFHCDIPCKPNPFRSHYHDLTTSKDQQDIKEAC